jgi:hypothetical protein
MPSRRGRPRRSDQLQDRTRQVTALFRRERAVLEDYGALDGFPGTRQVLSIVAKRLPRAVHKKGTALDLLIQGAALDVMGDLYATERPSDERLAQFIQAYFFEERTIVDITTNVLRLCDRSNVRNAYQAVAFALVARRFLNMVDHDDPLAISSGLQEALERQEQRWDRASRRVSDALQQLYVHRFGTAPLNVSSDPSGSSLGERGGTVPGARTWPPSRPSGVPSAAISTFSPRGTRPSGEPPAPGATSPS